MGRDRRLVLTFAIATVVLALIADVRKPKGKGKSGKSSTPKIILGSAFAFFVVGMVAEVNPKLGKAIAALIFVGTLFTRGEDVFAGLTFGARGERPRAGDADQRARWIHGK